MKNIQEIKKPLSAGMIMYIIARTILVLLVTPIIVSMFYHIFDPSVDINLKSNPNTYWIAVICVISLILYFQSYKQTTISSGKFLIGVFSLYIGHIGVIIFYYFMFTYTRGGFSGIFLLPPTMLTGVFYFIAFMTLVDVNLNPRAITNSFEENNY